MRSWLRSSRPRIRLPLRSSKSYQKFLHDTVLPRSHGRFQLGAETYRKKLLYDEMVDIRSIVCWRSVCRPAAEPAAMKVVAAQIDPKRTVAQVLADLQNHHQPQINLLQAFRDTFAGLQQFIAEKKIITIHRGSLPPGGQLLRSCARPPLPR